LQKCMKAKKIGLFAQCFFQQSNGLWLLIQSRFDSFEHILSIKWLDRTLEFFSTLLQVFIFHSLLVGTNEGRCDISRNSWRTSCQSSNIALALDESHQLLTFGIGHKRR